MNIIRKGLTGFDLKYLALIFMVLDHIHYFFEFTGKVPIWFSWLGRLVANLNDRWQEQQEQKRQMARIAHDLKTPLTIIRGNADLLLENESDEEKIEFAQSIINNAERIARSILEILEQNKELKI